MALCSHIAEHGFDFPVYTIMSFFYFFVLAVLGEVGGKKMTKPHGCQREGEVDVCVGASLSEISHELCIDIDG